MRGWQNSFSACLRRTQWAMEHGQSVLRPGTRIEGGDTCRCGNSKKPRHVVCSTCWFSAPVDVRNELNRGDVRARRAAARVLLEFAGGRAVLKDLKHA